MGSHPEIVLPYGGGIEPARAADVGRYLAEPFEAYALNWKPQSVKGNRCLPAVFVKANQVTDRLDEVVGWQNWRIAFDLRPDCVHAVLAIKVGGEWIEKAGVGGYSKQEDAGHRAKAGESDAIKRAGLAFGIGRYLHDLRFDWVDYDPVKKIIPKLPRLPAWALPAVIDQYQTIELEDWIKKVGGKVREKMLEIYRVHAVEELPLRHFDAAMQRLKAAHARAVKLRAEKGAV